MSITRRKSFLVATSTEPTVWRVEIGFHAEYKDTAENERVIAILLSKEKVWRKQLGAEAEVGVFLGADKWRRVSETWVEPDLDDPELGVRDGGQTGRLSTGYTASTVARWIRRLTRHNRLPTHVLTIGSQ